MTKRELWWGGFAQGRWRLVVLLPGEEPSLKNLPFQFGNLSTKFTKLEWEVFWRTADWTAGSRVTRSAPGGTSFEKRKKKKKGKENYSIKNESAP